MTLPKLNFANIKNLRLIPKLNNNKIAGMSLFDYLGKVKEQKFTFNDPKPAPYTKRLKEQVSNIIGKNSIYLELEQSIHQLMESLPSLSQQQMLSWLRLGEDLRDIENALLISSKQHNFKADNKISTSEFIQKFVNKTKGNYRPEEHPEYLTFVRELPDGSKIYDVKDSEDAARHLSDLIYAQRGDSPWCVLHKDNDGNWMDDMWNKYTGVKKADGSVARQVLFNSSGELVSFNASESKNPIWWDLADLPQESGIIKTVTNYPTHRSTRSFNLDTNTWVGDVQNTVVRGNPKRGLYIEGEERLYTVLGNDGKVKDNGNIKFTDYPTEGIRYNHETGIFGQSDPYAVRTMQSRSNTKNRIVSRVSSTKDTNSHIFLTTSNGKELYLDMEQNNLRIRLEDKYGNVFSKSNNGDLYLITPDVTFSVSKDSQILSIEPIDPVLGYDDTDVARIVFNNKLKLGLIEYAGGEYENISKSEFDKLVKPYRQKLLLANNEALQAVRESKFQDFGHTVINPSDWRLFAETIATQFRKGGILNYLDYIK